MPLGRYLKTKREELGITPATAAKICKVSLIRWQLIEENRLPPTVPEAEAIADLLNIPRKLMLCYAEPKT